MEVEKAAIQAMFSMDLAPLLIYDLSLSCECDLCGLCCRWLSAIHRVVPPDMGLDEPTKVTCAFFSSPAPDAMIECLPSCLDQTSSDSYSTGQGNIFRAPGAKYPPINAGDFQRERSELHAPGAKASGRHLIEDPRKKPVEQ